jgi:hypothetical protein
MFGKSLTQIAVILLGVVVVLAFATATGSVILTILGAVAIGLVLLDGNVNLGP